jgi:hypothetical protein
LRQERAADTLEAIMISRLSITLAASIMAASLFAPAAPAQGRGARGSAGAPRARSSFGLNGREGLARPYQRRLLNDSGFFLPPYFYSDDAEFDNVPLEPGAIPVQLIAAQAVSPPPPPPTPAEPLVLEIRDGQWVRVPTGSEIQAVPQTAKPDSAKAASPNSGIIELPGATPPAAALPPAVIVFRDGHTEEVAKYMIEGVDLYTTADYWTSGSWTRKIPLAQVDIPASLKLNKERGSKFNLPSGPNEVVVRF